MNFSIWLGRSKSMETLDAKIHPFFEGFNSHGTHFPWNVMAMLHVDTNGRQSLPVNRILGMQQNPAVGILADPLINLSISAKPMSLCSV